MGWGSATFFWATRRKEKAVVCVKFSKLLALVMLGAVDA
jgi:hypothetical protein